MARNSRTTWIVISLLLVILLVLALWSVFSVAKRIFKPSSNSSSQVIAKSSMDRYNKAGTEVILEVQGPIKGDESFYLYRIKINRNNRVVQLVRGYDGFVEKEQTFPNNEAAYGVFLKALDTTNFELKNQSKNEDERGSCPLGRRFIYSIQDGSEQVFHSWAASCNPGLGTSEANPLTRTLFQNQIPKFNEFVAGQDLN